MIFISYSHKDSEQVDRLAKKLTAAGHKVWVDRLGIGGGTQWQEEIVRAINTASAFLLVLSENSVHSDHVRDEFNVAREMRKRLLPVCLEEVEVPAAMQLGLSGIQRIYLSHDFDAGTNQLLAVLPSSAENKPGDLPADRADELEVDRKPPEPERKKAKKNPRADKNADRAEPPAQFESSAPSDAPAPRNANAFALIVGIGAYQDDRIPRLKYTHADARAFYELLTDPQRSGFQKQNVRLLIDAEATHTAIRKSVNQWLYNQVAPDSTVLIFFAGHGGQEQDKCESEAGKQAYYFLPWDADPEDLASTSLSQSDFERLLRTLKAQRMVMFLDACHSTGVAKAGSRDLSIVTAPKYERLAEGAGRVVIAAARPEQRSWEDERLKHGIFTYHLLEALRGKADTNEDGYVSIQDVAAYLKREVPRTVKLLGKEPQDPTMICESLTPDITLTVDLALVKRRERELNEAKARRIQEMQARRLKLVELRNRNELPLKEFTEAMALNEKAAEEFTPTEMLLKEYLDLLLTDRVSAQLYLQTRTRIYSDTAHIRKPQPPPMPPPAHSFCIHCGGRNAADNVFCFQCGKRLQ